MADFEKLAVVIGINRYDHGIPRLETPVNDAKELAKVLKHEHSYNQIALVLEEKATLSNLNNLLKNLSKVVKENTCLLFYFAGHGIALNGDEGPEGYLIPQDAVLGDTSTYLPMPSVEKALTALPCRHCLIILDCCFAGAFRWSSTRHIAATPKIVYQERYERFTTDPAWQVIASSAHDQKAIDALAITKERDLETITDEIDGRRHSPFAKALLDALRGEADTYPPAKDDKEAGDGIITATELYLFLRDRVEELTLKLNRRQTPGLWSLKKHDKGEYIFLTKAFDPKNLAPAPLLDEKRENNPYRGLEPYEREHSNLFFGRVKLTEKLCDAVCDRPITVVLGASGSGKSSLVKAGLVGHLEQSDKQGKQVQNRSLKSTIEAHQHKHRSWSILPPLRPTESPLNSLSQLIKALTGKEAINFTPQLLVEAIEEWRRLHPDSKLLLIIDQAEELVTLCRDEQERGLFLQLLIRAAIAHPKHLRVVFTLRSDFEPQIRDKFEVQLKEQLKEQQRIKSGIEPLLDAQSAKPSGEEETNQGVPLKKYLPELVWRNARFIVPAMSRDELREAIEGPALTRVVFFKPHTLVDQLIDEVSQMPGALPLLSFALSELYLKLVRRYQSAEAKEEIIERAITQEDYVELGGVTRSLTQRADKEYKQLVKQHPAYAKTIRNVMLRMVALGGDLARRRVLLSELNYPEPENKRVATVIQCFSAARLLTPDTDAQHQPTIEPAHDALIRGWSNIQNWKNEDQEELSLQGLLTPAVQEWINNKYKSGFLWDENPRIILLKQVLKRKHNWLNFSESDFVKKSLQHRRNSRLRLAVSVVGTIAALAGISVFALIQLQLSVLREKAARVINQLSAEPLSSLLLAIEATDESASRLGEVPSPVQYSLSNAVSGSKEQNLLRGHEGTVFSVAFSPNSQLIASSGEDGTIRLWNLAGQSVGIFKGHEQTISRFTSYKDNKNVTSITFSPDGKNIASGGSDGTVRLWDLQGNQVALLGQFSVPIDSVAFHPDGYKVAVSSDNGVDAWLIDLSVNSVQTLQNPLRSGQSKRNEIRFTPDGKFIVKQAGGTLSVFNFAGELLDQTGVASRSGHLNCSLAIVDRPDRAAYWIYSGQCRHGGTFPVAEYEVEEFYLDSEGRLGIGSEFLPRMDELKFDLNCKAEIFSLDATSSGTLISGCGDGVISMSRESTEVPAFLRGHTASVNAIAISPNEKHLVSADSDGTIRLWDLSDFFHVVELPYNNLQYQGEPIAMEYFFDWTHDVAFDPKGEFWAIARQKTVMLFDMQGNLAARPFEHDEDVRLVAFNPRNRTILSVEGLTLTLRLWDLQGNLVRNFEVDQGSDSIAFSPDGQMILSGDGEGTLSLWSLSGQKIGEFKGHEDAVTAVAFSPDGKSIISGSDDDTLRLWNLQGSTLRIFKGHDDNVTSVAFSPDGQSIVSGSDDHTLRLWNLNNESTTLFRGHTASVRTVAFNPTGNIIVSAGLDPAVRFWSVDGSTIAPPFEPTMKFNPSHSMAAISPDGKTIVSSVSETAKEHGGRLFLIRGWNGWEEWLGKACDRLRYHPVLLNPTTLDQRKAHDACKLRNGVNEQQSYSPL